MCFVVLTVFNVKETLKKKKTETKVSATHIKHGMMELGIANVISCEKIGKPQKSSNEKQIFNIKFRLLNFEDKDILFEYSFAIYTLFIDMSFLYTATISYLSWTRY